VQLGAPARIGDPADIAAALRAGAAALGHRPAVTVLHEAARYEQSAASIANWAAKGAHLLELDHLVGAGTPVGLLAPPCWTTAGAALAAWWLGAVVVLDAPGAVTVLYGDAGDGDHPGEPDGASLDPATVLVTGDGLDGAPLRAVDLPAWTREAQPLPDHPPAPQAAAQLAALRAGAQDRTQGALLAMARELGTGTAGVEVGVTDPGTALVATTLRPLLTGQPTVVLRGVGRDAAAQERVSVWL